VPAPRRISASILIATVLLTSALPCPPAEAQASDAHGIFASAASAGGSERPLELGRACPCSCEKKAGFLAGTHPGFGLARAEEPPPTPDAHPLAETATPGFSELSSDEDAVPI
jgi:hypothetical protein